MLFEPAEEGGFVVTCPALPGLVTEGDTIEEARQMAEDALLAFRDRFELRRLVATLTAQGRMSRWIVSGIPVALLLLLRIVNPHYLDPLTGNLAGQILLGIATTLVIAWSAQRAARRDGASSRSVNKDR